MYKSHIVAGLGYGDEGKGSWVDHLVRKYGIRHIVRFNGGAQALHHVHTAEGLSHGFSQFGSGMFVEDVVTILSRFMLIDPDSLFDEACELESLGVDYPLERLLISKNAPVITPFNRLLNRILEVERGASRHGSCGLGIGLTQEDVEEGRGLYIRDLGSPFLYDRLLDQALLKLRIAELHRCPANADLIDKLEHVDINHYTRLYADLYSRLRVMDDETLGVVMTAHNTVFEGAQGVLLDQVHGFFPHVTRSNTTFENAELLLSDAGFKGEVVKHGLLRAYATRHGQGPFLTESPELIISDCDNSRLSWQGNFRSGWFDAVAARYALEVSGGVNNLVITNLDRLDDHEELNVAVGYKRVDGRFFSSDRIVPLEADYELLAERTASMAGIEPDYMCYMTSRRRELQARRESYLSMLDDVIGRRVTAYSVGETADNKIYR